MSSWGFSQSREQSLASDFASHLTLGSGTVSQLFCQPCKVDNQSIPACGYCQTCAEHLCQACYQTHCKPAPSRNHILLDKTQMPQTQGSGINIEETCKFHSGKAIEYFCQDHQVLGCSPCITIYHRGCSTINYIPEAAENFNNSNEYRQLLSDIDNLKAEGEMLKMSTADDLETILQRKDAIKQEIRAFSEECLQKIKAWENTLMKQNDTLHDAEYAKSRTVADQSVKTIEAATKLQANLETLQNSGNQSTLYIQAKKSAETVQTMKANIEQCDNNNQIQEYILVKNQRIQGLFRAETNLGYMYLSRNQSMFQTATNSGQVLYSPRNRVPIFKTWFSSNSMSRGWQN